MTSVLGRPMGGDGLDPISWAPPAPGDRLDTPEPSHPPMEYLLSGWWSPESVNTASRLVTDVDALLAYLDELALLDHRIRARGDLHKLARRAARNAQRLRDVIDDAVPEHASTGVVPSVGSLPTPAVEAQPTPTNGAGVWRGARHGRVRRRGRRRSDADG